MSDALPNALMPEEVEVEEMQEPAPSGAKMPPVEQPDVVGMGPEALAGAGILPDCGEIPVNAATGIPALLCSMMMPGPTTCGEQVMVQVLQRLSFARKSEVLSFALMQYREELGARGVPLEAAP